MISIRRADINDAVSIATIHVVAWRETYRGIVPDDFLRELSIERRTANWIMSLSNPYSDYYRCFVAEVDGQVVGFCNYGFPQENASGFDGELFAIYILRSAQGRGVGRHLVDAAVKGLTDIGSTSMLVWVLKDNKSARGFYEHLGGVYVSEKPIEIGGKDLMEVAYGWSDLSGFWGGDV